MCSVVKQIAKPRQSNIELLRIVLMFLIVLHHYCVNSGLVKAIDFGSNAISTIIVQFMSFGGKVGVTGFFIITGYFMVTGKMRIEKLLKFVLQIFFYNIVVFIFLHFIMGYEYTTKTIIKNLTPIVFGLPTSFIGSYFFVYILTPVMNPYLQKLSRSQFIYMLAVLLTFFSLINTFLMVNTWHYFGWGVCCYMVGAFIRLHDFKWKNNGKAWMVLSLLSLFCIWSFMVVCDLLGGRFADKWTYMMTDANKFFIFTMSVGIFLWFKNMKISCKPFINTCATAVFGVLLIHANSNTMRQWLWKDLRDNVGIYSSTPPLQFLCQMLIYCTLIYIICTIIELFRIRFIEKPLFNHLNFDKFNEKLNEIFTVKQKNEY